MRWRLGAGLLALLLACAAAVTGLRYEPPRRPLKLRPPGASVDAQTTNVVLVIGCTVRADQLTPFGGPTHATPFLEGLAQEGTRFAFTLAQAPWTRPAIASILTSRHALAIGLTEPSTQRNRRELPQAVRSLAEHMRESGRATFGLAANPNASSAFGFAQGFDEYWDGPHPWTGPAPARPSGTRVARGALDMLRQHRQRGGGPFYLQLVLIDAHKPDDSDWVDLLRYRERGLPLRVARYRARLSRLDAAIAQLDAGLAGLGYDAENTLFVFVGDHGEGLDWPRHHGPAHGRMLNPSVLGVPWIVRGPGVARGHVVHGIAGQIDTLPTLLGLLGLPPEPEAQGHDWSAQLAGRPRSTRQVAFADTWFADTSRTAVYSDSRLCQHDWREQRTRRESAADAARGRRPLRFPTACYDLADDPLALRPILAPDLQARIAGWRSEQLALRAAFGEADAAVVDARTGLQLEALGYGP